ncbi:MAG: hypothetical protein F6K53_20805 [Moorea sp. SIO4A1]|nr:hypothetical protein [Moorena sp. SIO4A1]NEQ59711.1 hypothetical protein [Moorena sp. SIO4A1]
MILELVQKSGTLVDWANSQQQGIKIDETIITKAMAPGLYWAFNKI